MWKKGVCSKQKNSKCRGPEALMCLACLQNCREAGAQEGSEPGERLEVRSEGWLGAASSNAIRALEGLADTTSCVSAPPALPPRTYLLFRMLSNTAALFIEPSKV